MSNVTASGTVSPLTIAASEIDSVALQGMAADGYLRYVLGLAYHRNTGGEQMMLNGPGRQWLDAIYHDRSDNIVIEKASQVGVTEWLLCDMFSEAMQGRCGTYILPTDKWRNEFVPRRIDKTISRVPLYRENASLARKDSDMKSQKVFWGTDWRFVGSNSEKNFYEAPADTLIFDEYDKCDKANLIYAYDRLGAAEHPKTRIVGNPTIPSYGIDDKYDLSDKKSWQVKCEHCGEWQPLDWFVNVVNDEGGGKFTLKDTDFSRRFISSVSSFSLVRDGGRDAHVLCRRCYKFLDRLSGGEWIAEHKDQQVSGYQVSRIFGDARINRQVIGEMFIDFIAAQTNASELQRFYNNILGIPYEASGSKITDIMLADCTDAEYAMPSTSEGAIGGCDVGGVLHLKASVIVEGVRKAVFIGTCRDFDELDFICRQYGITRGVIDALPETHAVKEFIRSHPGWLACRYTSGDPKTMQPKVNWKENTVDVGRTESLDASFAAYAQGRVVLPKDWRSIDGGEFYKQMMASVRVYNEDRNKYEWQEGAKADHYRHADNYECIASGLSSGSMVTVI